MEVKIQVEVLLVATPCSVVVGYQPLHPEDGGTMNLCTLVSYPNTTRRHNQQDLDSNYVLIQNFLRLPFTTQQNTLQRTFYTSLSLVEQLKWPF